MFAWRAVKHVTSNGVVLARGLSLVGFGTGQASAVTGQLNPLILQFQVTGIFETGLYDYDNGFMYIALDKAQELAGLGQSVTGIEVKTRDRSDAKDVHLRRAADLELEAPIALGAIAGDDGDGVDAGGAQQADRSSHERLAVDLDQPLRSIVDDGAQALAAPGRQDHRASDRRITHTR
jgi:hypothetical protein